MVIFLSAPLDLLLLWLLPNAIYTLIRQVASLCDSQWSLHLRLTYALLGTMERRECTMQRQPADLVYDRHAYYSPFEV